MGKRLFTSIFLFFCISLCSTGQNVKNLCKSASDSLAVLIKDRTSVTGKPVITDIKTRGKLIDIHFNEALSDYNWAEEDVIWLRTIIQDLLPEQYNAYNIGNIYCVNTNIKDLITPALNFDGKPSDYTYRHASSPRPRFLVRKVDAPNYSKGLSNRYIALWQSHGRYYEESTDRWEWQRSPNHRTVEDMFTQSFVLPFLIPMLENAGAYVFTPRERDTQIHEIICDNDPGFERNGDALTRTAGNYHEQGRWEDAGIGFADAKQFYTGNDNPFRMGTARKTAVSIGDVGNKAKVQWDFTVPENGEYAVYVSYPSFENSYDSAHYTVYHSNGSTSFSVNQKLCGGTWVYLGTFAFAEGGIVSLDNTARGGTPSNTVIAADAIKIGGGMGKIARGLKGTSKSQWKTSGMPSYTEGALYWMQWAGVDSTVTRNWDGDYTQDFAARGAWVSQLCGGSSVNPDYEGQGGKVPIDLSLGFHTDAGVSPNDSTVGTLSIYTLKADNRTILPDGRSRQLCRHLAGIVQDQVCNDIRAKWDPAWSRRMLWDKNYSESRTTSVPAMILELMSHQNFADMKYGLDPEFRFDVSRAVYKGVLKYLADEYGVQYVVQPLPISSFSVQISKKDEFLLSWKETPDTLEPTAVARSFILYTRMGDGDFDQGVEISPDYRDGTYSTKVEAKAGILYSFRIVAQNDGGRSFPSETLCAGIVPGAGQKVLVVNNFTRISSPTWFDTPQYAGFLGDVDSGVPYIKDISYIGNNYELRRDKEWIDDDCPGFGASFSDYAGKVVAGNTFDFVSIHCNDIMSSGYSVESSSVDAFARSENEIWTVDLLCGKQVKSTTGAGVMPPRFGVFPTGLQNALRRHTTRGTNVIISGSKIGTDVWDEIYPVKTDTLQRELDKLFVMDVLGYKWLSGFGSYTGQARIVKNKYLDPSPFSDPVEIRKAPNPDFYCVENPDALIPSGKESSIFMNYTGGEVPAAVISKKKGYMVFSFGFPLECITNQQQRQKIFKTILDYIYD